MCIVYSFRHGRTEGEGGQGGAAASVFGPYYLLLWLTLRKRTFCHMEYNIQLGKILRRDLSTTR